MYECGECSIEDGEKTVISPRKWIIVQLYFVFVVQLIFLLLFNWRTTFSLAHLNETSNHEFARQMDHLWPISGEVMPNMEERLRRPVLDAESFECV